MKILLCSNTTSIRERWHKALKDLHTVFQATTPGDVQILLKESTPDIMLIHQAMMGFEGVQRIMATLPGSRIFLLTDRPDDAEGLEFLRIGVVGYANSYINDQRLVEAVRAIASGSVWINQKLMQRLITGSQPTGTAKEEDKEEVPAAKPVLEKLSNREYQIACLVADGLSNPDIATRLDITERTVKAHLSAVYAKTSTKGRLNLALLFSR